MRAMTVSKLPALLPQPAHAGMRAMPQGVIGGAPPEAMCSEAAPLPHSNWRAAPFAFSRLHLTADDL